MPTELYYKYKDLGLCTSCGHPSPDGLVRCSSCHLKLHRRRAKIKVLVFEHYGNECACCGEDEFIFLSIDHINNDPSADKTSGGHRVGGDTLYRRLIRKGFPEGYQLLCYNCNFGKYYNGGICPHNLGGR